MPQEYIPSGIAELDELTGGYPVGRLTLIVGKFAELKSGIPLNHDRIKWARLKNVWDGVTRAKYNAFISEHDCALILVAFEDRADIIPRRVQHDAVLRLHVDGHQIEIMKGPHKGSSVSIMLPTIWKRLLDS